MAGPLLAGGSWMDMVLRLVETRVDGRTCSIDVLELSRFSDVGDIGDLGLTLSEAKQLLAHVQQAVVAAQARDHASLRPGRLSCGARARSRRCSAR